MADTFTPSKDTRAKLDALEQAKTDYETTWSDFEEKAEGWFRLLEEKRAKYNRTLDEATRAVREEAKEVDYKKLPRFKVGLFDVQKKMSRAFDPHTFLATAKAFGVEDAVRENGLVTTTTEINREIAIEWLKARDLWDHFKDTYKEEEMTPSVSGPKEVPAFGRPAKK